MKAIVALALICTRLSAGELDDQIVLSPFQEETSKSEYRPAEWNFDIPLFVLGISGYWAARGEWPSTISEVAEGILLWGGKEGLTEEGKAKLKEQSTFSDSFEFAEKIPMHEGIAYRVVYRRAGVSVNGLIVLREGASAEEVAKSVHYSEDLARIAYSVPF